MERGDKEPKEVAEIRKWNGKGTSRRQRKRSKIGGLSVFNKMNTTQERNIIIYIYDFPKDFDVFHKRPTQSLKKKCKDFMCERPI